MKKIELHTGSRWHSELSGKFALVDDEDYFKDRLLQILKQGEINL